MSQVFGIFFGLSYSIWYSRNVNTFFWNGIKSPSYILHNRWTKAMSTGHWYPGIIIPIIIYIWHIGYRSRSKDFFDPTTGYSNWSKKRVMVIMF